MLLACALYAGYTLGLRNRPNVSGMAFFTALAVVAMVTSLPFILARNIEAPTGTTLRATVMGEIAFERCAAVDDEGRGLELDPLAAPDDTTIAITTDWETYARLSAGRLDVAAPDVLARITLTGDATLAARIPESLAITP